jgi:hypothetical protein
LPETVTASRNHLTVRYALGVDKLLWELKKRPMPDGDAVRSVISAAGGEGHVDALDLAAALVVTQAMRLELDVLEAEVLDAAQASGVGCDAVAAMLDLPDGASAQARHRMLDAKRKLPQAPPHPGEQGAPLSDARDAAARAGRRAESAAARAAAAKRRGKQLRDVNGVAGGHSVR